MSDALDTGKERNIGLLGAVGIGVGAIVGGLVSALIAGRSLGPKILAAAMLVFGVITAVPVIRGTQAEPGPRPADEAMQDTLKKLEEPTWVAIANPIVGFAGVMIGAAAVRRKKR